MVASLHVDPNWVVAICTSGAAGVGAWRWYRVGTAKRKRRQAEYRTLWQAVFGKPELRDDTGVVYEPAELGIDQRIDQLEGAFYGHREHPPHPGRRRDDGLG